ncbi:hypothetical protein DH2020_048280 [Rehmannia glutinosa]|uniref:Uncharacterized protein n=1 Tax=Rehmannia glutinosa TaxID=99300 RepID=A0ABR0U632_REHGL
MHHQATCLSKKVPRHTFLPPARPIEPKNHNDPIVSVRGISVIKPFLQGNPVVLVEQNIQFITDSTAEETRVNKTSSDQKPQPTQKSFKPCSRNLREMDAQEVNSATASAKTSRRTSGGARVISSERRAARYQHELNVGKEEALRMLMRLKQMMDFKISQTEAASLNQQKKIDELEAQLQEAEDIVKDLREELGEAQTELERLKKDNLQHLNELNNACSRETENTIYSYHSSKFLHPNSQEKIAIASDVTIPNPSQRNECCKCNSETVCMCSSYTRNRDLPSIIMRGKKPGLYRNGCTQRIRACERNLLDKELCLSGETDKVNGENSSREQEEVEDANKAPAYGAKTLSEDEQKLLADTKLSKFQSFPQKRKRATRRIEGKVAPLRDETGVAESFSSPDCKVDVLSNGLELKSSYTTEGLRSQSVRERVIKYTFQRKRKREVLAGSEVNAIIDTEKKTGDKINGDQNTGDKQNGDQNTEDKQNGDQNLEQSKTSFLKESSRDSRQLAQVARQVGG